MFVYFLIFLIVAVASILVYLAYYEGEYLLDTTRNFKSKWVGSETDEKVTRRGSGVINIDGESRLFVCGGSNQNDIIFNKDLTIYKELSKDDGIFSMGVAVCDMNNDGMEDLIITRNDGIHIYYQTNNFTNHKRIYKSNPKELCCSVSIGDIYKNGRKSIFVGMFTESAYVPMFNFTETHYTKNLLLVDEGGVYVDKAEAMGVSGIRNTWTASFIDLTNDGYPDIVVANNAGPVEIYRNYTDGESRKFMRVNFKCPQGFWMGMAVGDFMKNGLQSMFFTNSGNTLGIPLMKVMGLPHEKIPPDFTPSCIILENNGNYNFSVREIKDVGFGWGASTYDINNDGNLDIVYSNNWKALPWHKFGMKDTGTVLLGPSYKRVKRFKNKHFSVTPSFMSGNLYWINNESPISAYTVCNNKCMENGNPHNKAKNISNANSSYKSNGLTYQVILGGTGLCSSRE